MIKRILIANRGEIALRIIKTCKKLGIETVAIASKSERDHPHLKYADQSIILEQEFPSEVYLDHRVIIETAKQTKAEAIHPGYGFLAENSEFSQAVNNAGLIFIGPNPSTLDTLGDKAKTRQLAIKLKVPVVPGFDGEDQSKENLLKQAKQIGFPVMLKAVMGGGGRGMRKVENEEFFLKELNSAQQEAQRLYSDINICLEKFVLDPRHVEVQVAGDSQGNYIHLFERDCSIQRRFQKVIEFSPANLKDPILDNLYNNALKIAAGSKLCGLATMEFLVSGKDIFFLEANPRIQVEHPVTEIVTGLDLVELQIKIANGNSIKQIKPSKNAFALEARIYAEAPDKNFITTSGRVRDLSLPDFNNSFELKNNIRFDHALFKGFEVNQYFDPMLCKILIQAKSYSELASSALLSLSRTQILGIETNLQLLIELFKNDSVFKLKIQDLENVKINNQNSEVAALALHLINKQSKDAFNSTWGNLGVKREAYFNYYVTKDKAQELVIIRDDSILRLNNKKIIASIEAISPGEFELQMNNQSYGIGLFSPKSNNHCQISVNGTLFFVSKIKQEQRQNENQNNNLLSPLPGKITKIDVVVGQKVQRGESLVSLESMKIEHNIKCDAEELEIDEILVETGANVNSEQELIRFKKRVL